MIKKIALFIATTCIFFFITEAGCRFFLPEPVYGPRKLIFNQQPVGIRRSGAVSYIPRKNLREIALYGKRVEYDITYPTNDFGLIDSQDYLHTIADPKYTRKIALVGDSFTAGSGYGNWVEELRRDIQKTHPHIFIYNLGIIGSGLTDFYLLLRDLFPIFNFDEIILLPISDDFGRPSWYPHMDNSSVRFCQRQMTPEVCEDQREPAIYIEGDRIENLSQLIESSQMHTHSILHKSYLVFYVHTLWNKFSKKINPYELYKEKGTIRGYLMGVQALGEIGKNTNDKRRTLIHLPQKEEVWKGEYFRDLREEVESSGFEYISAMNMEEWTLGDFHPNDSHPNAAGYKKIKSILKNYLL